MTRKYIIVADDSFKGFDEEIENLERKWGVEEIEPCEDCISRQAAIDAFEDTTFTKNEILRRLLELPSVTPQPKTGRWILDETDNSITCDKCGCLIWANDISNGDARYCPNCGARMEVEKDKGDCMFGDYMSPIV